MEEHTQNKASETGLLSSAFPEWNLRGSNEKNKTKVNKRPDMMSLQCDQLFSQFRITQHTFSLLITHCPH